MRLGVATLGELIDDELYVKTQPACGRRAFSCCPTVASGTVTRAVPRPPTGHYGRPLEDDASCRRDPDLS